MDDRQSLAFDKLLKEQKKKKAVLVSIVAVAAVLVFLLGLLFGVAVSSNALAVPAGAEDLVREDPLLSREDHVVLRSASEPEYRISFSGFASVASWLLDQGYTSSSSYFSPSDPLYVFDVFNSSASFAIDGVYTNSDGSVIFAFTSWNPGIQLSRNYLLAFDSPSLYHFFRYDVGVAYSDFVIVGFDKPIAVAEDTVASIFTVGDKLLAFVTDNVLVLIPLVLFLVVFAFGSIKRLITGV